MWKDPVVAETRALRDEYVRQFNYDAKAIFEDLLKKQAMHPERVVSLPPRKIARSLECAGKESMLNVNIEKLASYRIGMERGEAKGIEEGVVKGMEKGAYERSVAIARKLLALGGLSMAQVAATTGLPVAEVEALASQEKPDSQ